MSSNGLRRSVGGFTLVELMVTVAVVGILLSFAVPSFMEMTSRNRLTTEANQFVAGIAFARTEALKRGTAVTMCRSSDGSSCGTGGGGWEKGWIIFGDPDNNGARSTSDVSETVLRGKGAFGKDSDVVRGNGNIVNRITISNEGMSSGFNGQITICDVQRKKALYVVTAATGRARISPTPSSADTAVSCPP